MRPSLERPTGFAIPELTDSATDGFPARHFIAGICNAAPSENRVARLGAAFSAARVVHVPLSFLRTQWSMKIEMRLAKAFGGSA